MAKAILECGIKAGQWNWVSWNNAEERKPPGWAQARVWASAVEWEVKDKFLIPTSAKYRDRKLLILTEANYLYVLPPNEYMEPLMLEFHQVSA
jgi:hypothetical protein